MSEPAVPSLPNETDHALAVVESDVDLALLRRVIEAALLTAEEPLSLAELKRLSEVPLENRLVEECLQQIAASYADSGIELTRVASGWRFRARPELQDHLDRLNPQKPPRYSRAVMETLAIIAYRQPVTRGDIEEIRGVAVSISTCAVWASCPRWKRWAVCWIRAGKCATDGHGQAPYLARQSVLQIAA